MIPGIDLRPAAAYPETLQGHWLSGDGLDWRRVILDSLPPLRHKRGQRMPLILWKDGATPGIPLETVTAFLDRGITPHCELSPEWVQAARNVQQAKAPVVMLEGASGPFPYDLLGSGPKVWGHDFTDIAVAPEWQNMPCPALFQPWSFARSRMVEQLGAFKDAGVSVDAVLMDWETPPFDADFGACLACSRCRAAFAGVLRSHDQFTRHMRQLWQSLVTTTIGGAVRKVFPGATSGNWACYLSSRENPVQDWSGNYQGELSPGLLRASVPIAYGMTSWITPWQGRAQPEIDAAYAHLILRQISADTANRRQSAPWLQSFPWVARWVPVAGFDKAPAMSRPAYREVLRHSWLRGIDGMQIFNTERAGVEMQAVHEVIDAGIVYDEMLLYRHYLEKGEPLNLQVPSQEPLPLWSGLRAGRYAIIRATGWGKTGQISVDPWADDKILLAAPPEGATYLLEEGKTHGPLQPAHAPLYR